MSNRSSIHVVTTIFTKLPWSTLVGNRSSFMPITLLQHGYCTFDHYSFWTFLLGCSSTWGGAYEHFSKKGRHSWSCRTTFWRVPPFTKSVNASLLKVILARPSRHSTTGTFSSGTSGPRRFSLILLHERIRRRIRLCHFSTLIDIVAKTAIVSFHTLPVGFLLPTISKNSLYTLFCSLDSWPRRSS